MDIRKNRLIKQCEIVLGEDFDQDFIYEDVDFSKPSIIWESYLKYIRLSEKRIKGLEKKADESGIAYGILKQVFDRGMAAWKTGHRPGATPHQWAFARVNSFITGGKTRTTADKDLWAKHKGKKEDLENSLYGEELQEAKKVIAQVELWNGKKMKKSFKNQSAAEKFIKKMQDQEDVRGYNMYAEDLDEAVADTDSKAIATAIGTAVGAVAGAKKLKNLKKALGDKKKEKIKKKLEPFDDKIEKLDDLIKDIEERLSDFAEDIEDLGKVGTDESKKRKKEQIVKRMEAGKEKLQKVKAEKRKVKEAKRKAKEKLTKMKMEYREESSCPLATQDLEVNTENRDATIKKFNYGPLNVDEPGTYWKDIAKYWKTTEEAAKKSLCENCVAFDISPRMKDCMPGKTSDKDGILGYCWMHHFKCHSARSCHTWAKGGPIVSNDTSTDWQDRAKI